MLASGIIGFVIGLTACAFDRSYTPREMGGNIFTAVLGALEGNLIADFFIQQGLLKTNLATAFFVLLGSLFLVFIRKLTIYIVNTRTQNPEELLSARNKIAKQL